MPITPKILDNPKSDRVRRITDLARVKGRERSGRFLIEGPQSVREAVTWRPDVVQDLYVEVAQALDHPRIVSSTLERIVEASQDATIYVHQCTGDVIRRMPKAFWRWAMRRPCSRVSMTSPWIPQILLRGLPHSGRCAIRAMRVR